MNTSPEVDAYIAKAPKEYQRALKELRVTIRKAAPKARERISYRMPFYEYGGTGFKGRLVYFALFKNYIAVYVPPARAGDALEKLKKYRVTKASYHFPLDKPLPLVLIGKAVRNIVRDSDGRAKSK